MQDKYLNIILFETERLNKLTKSLIDLNLITHAFAPLTFDGGWFEPRRKHMDAMSSRISENLRQIRKEKKLSLDSMAEQTGVSKSMLGQIERGESSPTVATLWKIATGLHISFTALLEGRQTETQLIRKGEVSPLLSDEGRFRLFPFFPYDAERRFEMLSIELEPGTRSESVPHEDGTEEFVLVFEGALRLTVDGVEYVVEAGEGIRYLANKPHIYECHGTQKTKICMVIYYDK